MEFRKLINKNLAKCKSTIILLLCLVLLTATGFTNSTKNVTVIADGNKTVVSTVFDNPKSIIKQAGIKLDKNDSFNISTTRITNDSIITVKRAFPVYVNMDGTSKVVNTTANTVDELMKSLGLNKDDYITSLNHNEKLSSNSTIKINKVSSRLILKDQVEDFSVIEEDDNSMIIGKEYVSQEGKVGLTRLLVREKYKDGVKVSEEVVQKTAIVKPKQKVVKKGTQDPHHIGGRSYKKVIRMHASAYLPSDGGGSGITATGIKAKRGVVAVDPNIIPLGTKVFIPGYGEAIAADTGGAIRGHKIDLCMETYTEAINFGRKSVDVYILE